MEHQPTISAYTTTRNCIEQDYPWKECIQSMLGFSDEVVVVDGGSTDGTWEELEKWASEEEKLSAYKVERDWSHKRHAVFDGAQKAEARKKCTSDFVWQMDCDEVVHEEDYIKIKNMCKNFPNEVDLISLPVIEYWGSESKVRMDINPWKWRLSRNKDNITHGIPKQLQKFDENGDMFSLPGSDGCDYIDANSSEIIPHGSFYTQNVHEVKVSAMSGNEEALKTYENWFNSAIDALPCVHHYSWMNISRKIRTYKNYWSKHWQSLYDISQDDTPENNMFFDKSWKDVTDKEIDKLAKKLEKKMGGWVFHQKVDFKKPTPHIKITRSQPKVMIND